MAYKHTMGHYRALYARLLRLYPRVYRERFSAGMEQTFNDLCRERKDSGDGILGIVLWIYAETFAAVLKERNAVMLRENKRLIGIVVAIVMLLSIPLAAMQFTDAVDWDLFDFAVMAGVLLASGLAEGFAARRTTNTVYRLAFGVGLAGAFLLFWVNAAVGIIGNEGQPANLLYSAVFAIGLIGSVTARFRPSGMAWTLFAAAAAQMLVPVVAIFAWPPPVTSWSPGVLRVFFLNGWFAVLFVVSALLFRQAHEKNSRA